MEWSTSKLFRIEAGSIGLSANDATALLRFYDVPDDDPTSCEVRELARRSRQRHWAARYQEPGRLSSAYMNLLGVEADAAGVYEFQPLMVPTLLQTPAYARTVIAGTVGHRVASDAIDARVAARMARQARLYAADSAVQVHIVIDETVLQRCVGSRDIMREQVDHLLRIQRRGRVRLSVVPMAVFAYPQQFAVLEPAAPGDPALTLLERQCDDVTLVDDPSTASMYRAVFHRCAVSAVHGEAVEACLRQLRHVDTSAVVR